MFVKSCEIAYLDAEEYFKLVSAHDIANNILAAAHDKKLVRLATNAANALAALNSCDEIQIAKMEEEE